jgi:oxaloacetate decarboxylase gamma subunit
MPASELLMEGLVLMVLGMGIVFTFLIMLVFVLLGMSKIACALDAKHGITPIPATPVAVSASTPDNSEMIAVIAAAIHRFRAGKR